MKIVEQILRRDVPNFENQPPLKSMEDFIHSNGQSDGRTFNIKNNVDINAMWAIAMAAYMKNKDNFIRINTSFAKALQKQKNIMDKIEIKKLLPSRTDTLVAVLDFHGASVTTSINRYKLEVSGVLAVITPVESGVSVLWILTLDSLSRANTGFSLSLDEKNTFGEAYAEFSKINNVGIELVDFVSKILLYLMTDYNFDRIRAPEINTNNPIKCRKKIKFTEYLFDHALLSWTWKDGMQYKAGEWPVEGHFRFQPYGPGLTQQKLIWIDPHTRQRSSELLH